jgi:2-polyprenyl-3-methyl-5-hydroxy-6-metoxy-1,4-benzoquinol methylase
MDQEYLGAVRAQYEEFPYPPRDPSEERERLLEMLIDRLAAINHYCFRGAFDFEGARILVAGGGTGDSTIYLAEQLHQKDAEVVYLDISAASMQVAQQRAEIRRLDNIRWLHGSILSLAPDTHGLFDYISCTGVLHHLADPTLGLRRLKSVLKPSGGMGVMVYGKYGRTGVYQMQKLMRLINHGEADLSAKIANTRRMLNQLPPTNWFRHNENFLSDHKTLGDSGLVDLLLHEQDVAYSIEDVHAMLAEAGLHFVEFSEVKMRMAYRPELYVHDRVLLERIMRLDRVAQQSVAELLVGLFMKHDFYVSREPDSQAKLGSLSHVPFFFPLVHYDALGKQIAEAMKRSPNHLIPVRHETGFEFHVRSNPISAAILRQIDGTCTWRQIFENVRALFPNLERSDEELLEFFRPIFDQFRQFDWLLLREANVPAFPETRALQAEANRRSKAEASMR